MDIFPKWFAPVLAVGAAVVMTAHPAPAAVTFSFSQVNASTDASLNFGAISTDDSQSDQSSVVPAAGIHTTSSSSAISGADTASGIATVGATFAADAASGHFLFGHNTTSISAAQPSSLSADADSSANAVYDFTLTAPAVFTLNYTINSQGLASGGNMPDLSILLLDFTTFVPVVHSVALTTSGDFTSPVLDPGDYQFFVQNFDAQSSQLNDPGTTSTSLDADFAFSLTSVPEPDSWLLMGAGVGLFGVMLGRRRQSAVVRANEGSHAVTNV
jgi:PEP-CTERM motif